jgi:hypothetical protein
MDENIKNKNVYIIKIKICLFQNAFILMAPIEYSSRQLLHINIKSELTK